MHFKNAKSCSKLIQLLVNDILDYAQYESKTLMLNKEYFKVQDLFD